MSKKRSRSSVFDAVRALQEEDKVALDRRKANESQLKKSRAAKSQVALHSKLVECRILLQRCMQAEPSDESKDSCDKLLVLLLQARQNLMARSTEDASGEYETAIKEDATSVIKEEYDESCREEWKSLLNRRNKSVQAHHATSATSFGGKTSLLNSTFWEQVELSIQHDRLRSDESSKVFDDTKVYQHLLKDFVAAHNSNASDSRITSKSMGSTKRKNVDRRASKGRKIRYTPLPKLANFCFPRSRADTGNLDDDEWFASLWDGRRGVAK